MMTLLSALVLAASIGLLGLKVWFWHDSYLDLKAAVTAGKLQSVRVLATGTLQLAWLKVVDGVLYLGLGVLTWVNRARAVSASQFPYAGRIILLSLIGMEILKLLVTRNTRRHVAQDILNEMSIKSVVVTPAGDKPAV